MGEPGFNPETATREELDAWYLEEVGYSPIEDEPSTTTEELRELVIGFIEIEDQIYGDQQ